MNPKNSQRDRLTAILKASLVTGGQIRQLGAKGPFLSFRVRRPLPKQTWTEFLRFKLGDLDIGAASDIQFACHTRYNWESSGWGPAKMFGAQQEEMQLAESWHWTLLWNHTQRCGLFVGGLDVMNDPLRFSLEKQTMAVGSPIRRELSGATYTSDTLLACFTTNPLDTLSAYAKTFTRPKRPFAHKDRVGWNTFDYYQGTFSETDALENLDAIKKWPKLKKETRWLVLDGGWQDAKGSWVPGKGFGGSFENFCSRVVKAGLTPGIWLGPYEVHNSSPFAQEHPEALLKTPSGALAVRNAHTSVLDPTHPQALAFLKKVFGRLKRDGFRYFKIDFLDAVTLSDAKPYDRKLGESKWIRKGVEAIREAIGWDCVLVGCGTDLTSMTGLVDACRIGPDIHVWRSNIRFEARTLSFRWWMNGNLWSNDPDFLVVRNTETARSPKPIGWDRASAWAPFGQRCGKPISTLRESQVAATVVLMSGGHFVVSDRLSELTKTGRATIETALALRSSTSAQPLDFGARVLARAWYRPGPKALLAVFNWSEEPEIVDWRDGCLKIPHVKGRVTEVWSGKKLEAMPDTLPMKPFEVNLFRLGA